jgi:hypothetical protein
MNTLLSDAKNAYCRQGHADFKQVVAILFAVKRLPKNEIIMNKKQGLG